MKLNPEPSPSPFMAAIIRGDITLTEVEATLRCIMDLGADDQGIAACALAGALISGRRPATLVERLVAMCERDEGNPKAVAMLSEIRPRIAAELQ